MIWVNAIVEGLLLGGLYALFACGLSLLFGVVGVINLAHGDLAVLGAYVAVAILPSTNTNALWALLFLPVIFAAFGYVSQRTVLQRSLDSGPLTTLLVTFGLSVVIQNALLEGFSADSHSLSVGSLTTSALHVNSTISISYLRLGILVVAIVVLAVVQLFLARTSTGRQIRAVADDGEAAAISGVNTRHVTGIAASIAFATVAVAGLAYGMYSQFTPTSGSSLLLFAFEAVIIGGLGSLWGTLAGGCVIGLAQTIGAQIDPTLGILMGHLVFLAILVVRPNGLIPARANA
ncbi:MAG TPA: branched-chain amino acid ABC transporter permease [Mycobacteriales bacterium]|jgi:branched-chain amino acid transport system permease protein|nr:branched-chain amino acid ABC transporter permease [Mycobacteriales bacterium]